MKEILEHESWSTNPGASMYHEGNPGARILGGVCIMKELLGNKFLTNMFFCFFQKKTWSTVYVS